MALVASFVSTQVYYASLEMPGDAVLDKSHAWMIVGSLSGAFVSFFGASLLLMKRKYVATFFSLQSGHAWAKEKFIKGDTDELKAWTLGCNKKQWQSIRDDVKAWTMENWERWEEEKPEFFNDAFKASVDDDMIPAASLRKLNGAGGRRRSSRGDLLGGGERRGSSAIVPVVSPNS
jgi:hypothetical protein